jgi:hypothetical protein
MFAVSSWRLVPPQCGRLACGGTFLPGWGTRNFISRLAVFNPLTTLTS